MQAAGLVDKIEQHTHMVPHGDRSGVVIEPYLTDQWYVDAKTLAQPAIAAVREGRTVFVPKAQWEATFFNWMDNIQPWCISRQLWWGHQIPAWYGWALDGNQISIAKTQVFVAESEEEALQQARDYYKKDVVRSLPISTRVWARSASAPTRRRRNSRSGATKTCSTPGSPPRCGRSRRSAGPTRRRSSRAITRPTRWSPASTSSSSGSRA